MPWLISWRRRRRYRDDYEHGAVSAIVAIMLSGGVLLGMGALVIDVGQLYVEREQLQTGADAASWKIAMACVNKPATCAAAAFSGNYAAPAVTYAKANASDGLADAQICLNNIGCPAWKTAVTCPPNLANPGQYVEVRTTTVTNSPSNNTLVPPSFAGALSGVNYQGKQVGTCARVNWGPPADVNKVFALGISLCDFNRMTLGNTVQYGPIGSAVGQLTGLYPLVGLPAPTGMSDDIVPAALPAKVLNIAIPNCPGFGLDLSIPRGYVWLNNPDGTLPDANCMITAKVNAWHGSFALSGLTTGALGTACANKLAGLRGKPVLVPIFDITQFTVLTLVTSYRVVGYAPFVVTAYTGLLGGVLTGVGSLLGGSLAGLLADALCAVSNCIKGYFTKTLVPAVNPQFGSAGTNFGATIIGRTG
ncbi:MAG: Tad domain-containing protein [Actinoplanes sp.]